MSSIPKFFNNFISPENIHFAFELIPSISLSSVLICENRPNSSSNFEGKSGFCNCALNLVKVASVSNCIFSLPDSRKPAFENTLSLEANKNKFNQLTN